MKSTYNTIAQIEGSNCVYNLVKPLSNTTIEEAEELYEVIAKILSKKTKTTS